jgi:hypothetical protein
LLSSYIRFASFFLVKIDLNLPRLQTTTLKLRPRRKNHLGSNTFATEKTITKPVIARTSYKSIIFHPQRFTLNLPRHNIFLVPRSLTQAVVCGGRCRVYSKRADSKALDSFVSMGVVTALLATMPVVEVAGRAVPQVCL